MELIGLTGLAGSGKDTVGEYFHNKYGYTTISFADTLKDCLSVIFGWDRKKLEGRIPTDREWREQVDEWWANKLEIPHFTPRFAMTHFGTEVMRNCFHDEIWVHTTERKISQSEGPIVITDVRFPNEIVMVRKFGGTIFRVKRGDEPKWGKFAISALKGDPKAVIALKEVFRVHESEWLLYGEIPDAVIYNNSDLESLYQQCDSVRATFSMTA